MYAERLLVSRYGKEGPLPLAATLTVADSNGQLQRPLHLLSRESNDSHGIAATNASLDSASASEQIVYKHNHSHDQQEMNQAGTATDTESKTQ